MKIDAKTGFLLLVVIFIFFYAFPAAAADISVPNIEMASRGWVDNNNFVLSSLLLADLALTGGYKYAFTLGFYLDAPDIGKAFTQRNFKAETVAPGQGVSEDDYNALVDRMNNQAYIGFRIAKATARELFGTPLEFSYFLGAADNFCSGEDFTEHFGIPYFGTDFKGFYYFPEGIGGMPARRYNGIHGIRGSGFSLGYTGLEKIFPIFYVYMDFPYPQDYINTANIFGENIYSGDMRVLMHFNWLRLEVFNGISVNSGKDVSLRGGIMAHIEGNGVEFFTQIGIPGFTVGEKFSIDNLFFLFEPRLQLGFFALHLTFFYRPIEYIHVITPSEKGRANINIKFLFGNAKSGFCGGIETGGELKIDGSEDFVLHITPMMSAYSDGLRWDAKIRIKPLEFDTPKEMIEFFIGVRTAF